MRGEWETNPIKRTRAWAGRGRLEKAACDPFPLIPFSAFWLRSSVVSVLISLISDTWPIGSHDINLISFRGQPIRQLAVRAASVASVLHYLRGLAHPSSPLPGGAQCNAKSDMILIDCSRESKQGKPSLSSASAKVEAVGLAVNLLLRSS